MIIERLQSKAEFDKSRHKVTFYGILTSSFLMKFWRVLWNKYMWLNLGNFALIMECEKAVFMYSYFIIDVKDYLYIRSFPVV